MNQRLSIRGVPACFVWIDLRHQRTASSLYDDVCRACLSANGLVKQRSPALENHGTDYLPAYRINEIAAIEPAICRHNPRLLFFEFDFPNNPGLSALQKTKARYPKLPVFMLTAHHSEALAVWAFRSGVRDYFVIPPDPNEIARGVSTLFRLGADRGAAPRQAYMPGHGIPVDARFTGPAKIVKRTSRAVTYIEAHFHETIRLATVARLSGLSVFQFSRVFKKENGTTFSKFLQKFRISRALEILAGSHDSVSDTGFAVGFANLSYFDRVFRRHVGVSPSEYLGRLSSRQVRREHRNVSPVETTSPEDAKKY